MGREFLFLFDTSPCRVLPTFVSQLCPPRDVIFKAVVAEIVFQRVETGDDPSATNPPDLTTVAVRSLVTKLYRVADRSLAQPISRCIFLMVRIFRLMLVLLYTK
jgi:hypothetical protein